MLKSHTLQLEQSEIREKINGYLEHETELSDETPRRPGHCSPSAGIALELELRAALVADSGASPKSAPGRMTARAAKCASYSRT